MTPRDEDEDWEYGAIRGNACHACGANTEPTVGLVFSYRGTLCRVPNDVAIAVCGTCGSCWLSNADVNALSASFEAQRLAANAL